MKACVNSPINVVYFCEAIGSKADMVDTLFNDFKSRLDDALSHQNSTFTPAIAIHSPYSVHPFLIREILKIAQTKELNTQAHFLESIAEKEWLESSKGDMKEFFANFLNQSSSLSSADEFLAQFKSLDTSFTHCVEASNDDIKYMKDNNHSIIHCPTSNRLLCNKTLDLAVLDDFEDNNLAIGTDGLSSNISLSMFDELRNALFIHTNQDIDNVAQKLLLASTSGGAKALNINSGSLEIGKDADMIVLGFDDELRSEDICTQIILHTQKVQKSYIKGLSVI
jgi:cytosine/adenosine deaminase-related metal-dependent hydrolase